MKTKAFITFSVLFLLVHTGYADFSNYRYNPFQFNYPEYNYKADVTIINGSIESFENLAQVKFFGLSAYVPKNFVKTVRNEVYNQVTVKSDDFIFFMTKEKELLSGCIEEKVKFNNKDFCSAFSSTKELFEKLFTLTADDLTKQNQSSIGDMWIIHRKGFLFEKTKAIHIYKGKAFTAFVQVRKNNKTNEISKDITLFHNKLSPDHYVSMGTNISDDAFLIKFFETLK